MNDEYSQMKESYRYLCLKDLAGLWGVGPLPKGRAADAQKSAPELSAELVQLCTATGRDLGELKAFFREVEMEMLSYLPS